MQLSAEIPGRSGPLWQMKVEVDSTDQADGQMLRLRAHWKLALRREALPAPKSSVPADLGTRLGQWIEERTQSNALRPLMEPFLDRELSSWMELRASDAALEEKSESLLPERLPDLGVRPRKDQPVQSWAGELRGPRAGYGVLSLLRVDKDQLPPWVQKRLGDKPFQLAATVATAVEESPAPRSDA